MLEAKKLANLINELKTMNTSNCDGTISIMVETGEDESVIIGTPEAFIRFSCEILEAVSQGMAAGSKKIVLDGAEFSCVSLNDSLNEEGHVVIQSIMLANSEKDSKIAMGHFLDLEHDSEYLDD